jgi:hypothetical protein
MSGIVRDVSGRKRKRSGSFEILSQVQEKKRSLNIYSRLMRKAESGWLAPNSIPVYRATIKTKRLWERKK